MTEHAILHKTPRRCQKSVMRRAKAHLVHERLGEGWLVDLIVAVLTVAHDVHHHIPLPLLPPLGSKLAGTNHRLNIIAIDMEDWGAQGFGYVCAVGGAATLLWVSCESNLHTGADTAASGQAPCLFMTKLHTIVWNRTYVRVSCIPTVRGLCLQLQLMHDHNACTMPSCRFQHTLLCSPQHEEHNS